MTPLRNVARRCGLAALLAVVIATTIGAPPAAASGGASDLVIQVNLQRGYSIEDVTRRYGLAGPRAPWSSEAGIYLVRPTWTESLAVVELLAGRLDGTTMVTNAAAEPRGMSSTRFHSWPEGQPDDNDDGAAAYTEQLAETLEGPHQLSRGHGVTVAVLDTGIDAGHPVLRDRTVDGYDYIGDDDDPAEQRQTEDSDGNGITDHVVRPRHLRRRADRPGRAGGVDHADAGAGQRRLRQRRGDRRGDARRGARMGPT